LQVFEDPTFEVNGRHEISAVLVHQSNTLVIDVASLLDGIDTRKHRISDPGRGMSVRGHFSTESVGSFNNGLQFHRAVLRERGIVAFRDHPTRGHNFDNVCTVLDWFITASSICNAFLREGKLWREIVFVPVTTRYAECRPRNKHARAGHIAGIDCVTDIRISVRGHVSDGRESSLKSYACI
jgi:hypothetical protein